MVASPALSDTQTAAATSGPGASAPMVASAAGTAVDRALVAAEPAPLLAQGGNAAMMQQLIQENQQLKQRLERLESMMGVKASAPAPMLPKDGFFLQGDIGYQQRMVAGEDGYTLTFFNPGFVGSVGVGYRYNKNWRFSAEYANLSSSARRLAGPNNATGNTVSVAAGSTVDPTTGACTAGPCTVANINTNNNYFDTTAVQGGIVLNQYTLNAYYDLPGFGDKGRIRPYLGFGVGSQKSSIVGLGQQGAPSQFIVYSSTWAPLITFDAGLNYQISSSAEAYLGAKYALGSELWFQNTPFGNLLPQSSRNWIIKTGIRYTF